MSQLVYVLRVFLLFSFWSLLLDRNSLISVMCLDWRTYGAEKLPNLRELIFFRFQMTFLHLQLHIAYLSSMVEKLGRAMEFKERHTLRHPKAIHLMEENGQIFFLLLIFCEYHTGMYILLLLCHWCGAIWELTITFISSLVYPSVFWL